MVAVHDRGVDTGFDSRNSLTGDPDFQGDDAIFEDDVSADEGTSCGYRRKDEIKRVIDCHWNGKGLGWLHEGILSV